MSFLRYPKYKDSGVEWMGPVPADWAILPIRKEARLESGHTPSRNHPEYWVDCTFPWFSLADVWQIREANRSVVSETNEKISELGIRNSAARMLPPGTVMLSRTASVGFAAIMGVEMATTQDFANWVCGPRLLPHYLLSAFRAMRGEFSRLMMGSTHNTIYMPDIASLRIPLPTLDEQRAIVAFLEVETAKIDALVAEQERLIELLKEKRQAVISHAVTKGLNADASMRDSGIEWIGSIPQHWDVLPLKSAVAGVLDCKNRTPEYVDEGDFGVVRTTNVRAGQFQADQLLFTHQAGYSEWTRRGVPTPGDVLLTREAPAGEACIVPSSPRVCLGQRMMLIQIRPNALLTDSAFVLYSVYGPQVQEVVHSESMGSTVTHLRVEQIRNLPFLVPPSHEQREIGAYLRKATGDFEALVSRAQRSCDLLRERRAALVSAAVTGQIDVRPESMRTAA